MQRPRSLAAVLLVGLLALPVMGCEISFSVTEPLPVQTIQGDPLGGALNLDMNWQTDVSQQSEYQSRDFDRINEIWIRDFVLEIEESSPDATFDFVSSVEIRITATIEGTNRDEVVAWVPTGDPQLSTRRLRFQTTNIDILPFIQAESGYSVTVNYQGSVPESDVDVGGHVTYRLKVEL